MELGSSALQPSDYVVSNKIRDQIRTLLNWALVMSVLFAMIGATLYTKHIAGRLSLLSNNASRLGRGEPLLAPVAGRDEVAELDKNFHHAAKLIEEAKRMRQEVTAMVTHDLKTPLQSIRSYLEMLENGLFGELNDEGTRLLSRAEKSCLHMVTLINSVLQVEQLRAGKMQLPESNAPKQQSVSRETV